MQSDRRFFYEPEDIFLDVQSRLAKAKEAAEQVDYLTFVPDGEPTLDVNLGKEIMLLKALEIPVGVITNSSLLWRADVREELRRADWVSLKIDAVQEVIWRQIHRPHRAMRLSLILEGILAFAKAFAGILATETMLVRGVNDNDDCMKEVAEFLHKLQPHRAYLSIPTRPPAERWVRRPDEEALNRTYQLLAEKVNRAEYLIAYEGDSFAFTGDIEKNLLSITAVHPMREEAVNMLLSRAGSSWEVVDRLVAQGDLAKTEYERHIFYLRKFTKDGKERLLTDKGNTEKRYFETCQNEFWQKVFQLELGYLVEHLKGCRDVLSVGCGPAIIEGELAKHGFNVTGLDVSREALNRAPDKVRTVSARAEDMSFPDNSFDAVIYVASLQFVDDYRKALEKSASVLRPNGKIVIMLLNPASLFFKERVRNPSSYVSKIKHVDLEVMEDVIAGDFVIHTEYFLRVEGNEVYKNASETEAVLRIILGMKRDGTKEERE
jgi:wyosine [tRNA(Phe)-imidazoG37] synthetase (radical SAM superfamily)/SAM-dependent methyltransferase